MGSRLEANSNAVRKRIEQHTFEDETGEEYEASAFGGFPEYYRRKKIKLQNLDAERRRHNGDKPLIFKGVVVHVNGYTQPTLNDLHGMIVDHGGGFMQYLESKTAVTHIVASSVTPKKAVEFRRYRIVKPAWVVDSIAAGKLLPWDDYRLLNEGATQSVLALQNGSVTSQANTQRTGYQYQTNNSWYANQVKDFARRVDAPTEQSAVAPDSSSPTEGAARGEGSKRPSQGEDLHIEIPPSSLTDSFGMTGIDDTDLLEAEDGVLDEDIRQTAEPGVENIQGAEPSAFEPEELVEANVPAHSPKKHSNTIEEPQSPEDFNVAAKKPHTAEEHNKLLLADPKIWKSTVVNPGFLKQYYEESRLHHLSSWKAELKAKMQVHAQEQTPSQKARQQRPAGARRYILHVDFDCFFAAVSLRQYPQYEDKPVVVAHGSGTAAEIASCNYPARKFGVKNGMWMKTAQELCPELQVLPYDFKAYEEASRQFYAAVMDTGGIVQSVSIDEALLDVSVACINAGGHDGKSNHEGSMYREQKKADEIAQGLRNRIKEDTGCAVSVGIGANILLAKLALRKAKPAGQHQVLPDDVLSFIGGLTVQDLPGVAWSLGRKLEELGVKLVADLRELSKERLMTSLGPKTGQKLWEYARGIDRVEVGDQVVRKSVSAEVNWGVRFVTQEQVDGFMRSLCDELHNRLLNEGVKGQQLTMKIMRRAADAGLDPPKHLGHGKCDVFNKSVVLGVATNEAHILARESIALLKGFNFSPGELRGIGLQMTKLEPLNKGPLAGGQKRLQFRTADKDAQVRAAEEGVQADDAHRLDMIETPKKPDWVVRHEAPALAASAHNASSSRPLNVLGTQFVLPSLVDPAVLAELPVDIRAKLVSPSKPPARRDPRQNTLEFTSRSVSPQGGSASRLSVLPMRPAATSVAPEATVPTAERLDPEMVAALPADVRGEVLAFSPPQPRPASPLHTSPSHTRQVRLPQSPQAARFVKQPLKRLTSTKRGRGRPRGLRAAAYDSDLGLLQSNLVPLAADDSDEPPDADIAEDSLATLPLELREELLAQHRSEHARTCGSLAMPTVPARLRVEKGEQEADTDDELEREYVDLPAPPPRPTFTARQLSSLPQLREVVDEWVLAMEGNGPQDKDVEALAQFLRKVVLDEKDMAKAVAVANWLDWVVTHREWSAEEAEGKAEWESAVHTVKHTVSQAVEERGLAPVKF